MPIKWEKIWKSWIRRGNELRRENGFKFGSNSKHRRRNKSKFNSKSLAYDWDETVLLRERQFETASMRLEDKEEKTGDAHMKK